jgi:hypothetical protein
MGCSGLQTCRTTVTIFSLPFLILMGCTQPGEDGAGADATLPDASVVASTEDELVVARLAHDFMEALSSRDAERPRRHSSAFERARAGRDIPYGTGRSSSEASQSARRSSSSGSGNRSWR